MNTRILTLIIVLLTNVFISYGQLDTRTQNQIKAKFFMAQEFYSQNKFSSALEKIKEIEVLTNGKLLAAAQNLKVKCLVKKEKYIKAKDELYKLQGLNLSSNILKDIASYSGKIEEEFLKEKERVLKEKRKKEEQIAEEKRKKDIERSIAIEKERLRIQKTIDNHDFSTGPAVYEKEEKYGFINNKGSIVIPLKFDKAYKFIEGLSLIKINNKWGFINTSGNFVIKPKYQKAKIFHKTIYLDHEKTHIDEEGNESTPIIEINLAIVKLNDKFGAIDKNGNEVIPIIYENNFYFNKDDIAIVELDNKFGTIGVNGKTIIPIIYENDFWFKSGRAKVKLNNKYWVINQDGKELIPIIYENDFILYSNRIKVKLNNKYGVINQDGEEIIPIIYENDFRFYSDRAKVKLNNKFGIINRDGKELIPIKYDYINNISSYKYKSSFKNRYKAKLNGKFGHISKLDGSVIIPFEYDELDVVKLGYLKAKKNDKYGVINKNNDLKIKFIIDSGRRTPTFNFYRGKKSRKIFMFGRVKGKLKVLYLDGKVKKAKCQYSNCY